MPEPKARPKGGHETDYEDAKIPPREGEAPRMANEPAGAEGSEQTPKTRSDPASGRN